VTAAELAQALGDARREGNGYRCRCPLADEHAHGDRDPSFSVVDSADGGKTLAVCRSRHEGEQERIVAVLKARGFSLNNGTGPRNDHVELLSLVPVGAPDVDGLARFLRDRKFADREIAQCTRFDYRDAEGRWCFSTFRFDFVDGSKEILPATVGRKNGKLCWFSKWLPAPRPLYGLDILHKRPDLAVLVLEGEAKTDKLNELDCGYVAVAYSAGSKRVKETDFSPLAQRHVVVWPDNDEPGFKAAIEAAHEIESTQGNLRGAITDNVQIVKSSADWAVGDDVADLIKRGWVGADIEDFIRANCCGTVDTFGAFALKRFPKSRATTQPIPTGASAIEGELALVDRLLEHKEGLLYSPGLDYFLWDSRRWLRDDVETVQGLAESAVREMYQKAAAAEDLKLFKIAKALSNRNRVDGALKMLRHHVAVKVDDLDALPYLHNVRNGVVDLRTSKLQPHARLNLITKLLDIDYVPSAKAPRFYKFLQEIFADDLSLCEYVKHAVGYSLTAEQKEKEFWFCWGPTDTGKTTFFNVLSATFGDYAQKVPKSLFLKDRDRIPSDVAQLRGVRFAYASETAKGRSFDTEKLKELTGAEGQLVARHMYAEEFRFSPTHHLWLASNYKPHAAADDGALWNRLRLIPFTVIFEEPTTDEKPEPKHPKDKNLLDQLLKEREGILAWAIEGAREWYANGFKEPQCVKAAGAEYRNEEDTLRHFVSQSTERRNGAKTKQSIMFSAYDYFMEGERGRMGKQAFNRALKDQYGFKPDHNRTLGEVWLDVELKEGALPPRKEE
jgi:putative DNA primase/helicase